MSFKFRKGQGATEYLVLLAVVLIVAMVAIALLGFFPGLSYDAKKSEADAYWRSVKPFQIIGHTIPSSGVDPTLTLVLQNADSDQMQIQNLTVAGSGYSTSNFTASSMYLSAGETRNFQVGLIGAACASGTIYEMGVNFTYADSATGLSGLTQPGVKTIIGKCS